MNQNYTVIVILEAKPGMEAVVKQALINVIEPSRSEKTCIDYRLHQNIENPAQFVLYENWISKEAHKEQFNKPYITAVIEQLDGLLVRPYQIINAQEL